MNLNTHFSNEKDKNEAIARLKSLLTNEDWRFFKEKIIQPDIDDQTNIILETNFDDLENARHFKRRRQDFITFLKLPEKIIAALENNQETIWDEGDPYYQNIKQLQEDKKTARAR